MPIEATHHFFHSLSLAALYALADVKRQNAIRESLAKKLKLLAFWAESCPENYHNRFALVCAEMARIEGRDFDAMRLYDVAIRSARENGFVQNEGLASQLAARFYLDRGFDKIAPVYLRDARSCYLQWGADRLVASIDAEHPALLAQSDADTPARLRGELCKRHGDLATVADAVAAEG